jgi:hypothetical protein
MTKIKSIEIVVCDCIETLDIYTFKDNAEMNEKFREDKDWAGACDWRYGNISVYILEEKINDIGLLAHEFLHATQKFMCGYNLEGTELECVILEYIMNSYFAKESAK